MRDLWVQKFLRELVVSVAAPSDLKGSFLVKILHCSEGGDVKQVAQISKQISHVCDCLSLSHLYLISCMFLLFLSLYA